MKKLTSFSAFKATEGERIAYTYSEIDSNGIITSRNNKGSLIVLDNEILSHIDAINQFINTNYLGV